MTIGVYMLEHVATGRRYIGKSIDVERRVKAHLSLNEPNCVRLHNAIAKHGAAAFTWNLLEECADDADAVEREVVWIRSLQTQSPNGFNLTAGGEGSSGMKRPGINVGRALSAETRAKISAGNIGKTIGPETRARMSAAIRGRVPARNTRPVTPETRAKLSAAGRGRKHTAETLEKMRQAWARRKGTSNA